jgi:hypothetical protein
MMALAASNAAASRRHRNIGMQTVRQLFET